MRPIIYLLLIICLSACKESKTKVTESSVATKQSSAHSPKHSSVKINNSVSGVPKSIDQIKIKYAATIEKLKGKLLDSVVLRYNCQNERSGTITYFSDNGKLLMINHSYAEYDHFQFTDKYFIQDEELYFAFQQQLFWSFEAGKAAESATKDDITELRTYIIDKQSKLCLEKKYTIHSSSSEKPDIAQIPNKTIKCKDIEQLLRTYNKLKNFKNLSNQECFEK